MSPDGGDGANAPVVVAGEITTQLAFLAYLRACVARKLDGVSDEDARRPVVPSGTSLLGLVKHLTVVERYWVRVRFAGLGAGSDGDGFTVEDTDTVATALAAYAREAAHTDEVVTTSGDPDQPLARGRHGLTLRWILAHVLEETARHAGHADILRELLDGTTGR